MRLIAPAVLAGTLSLVATPSFATLISITGGFTNFYTPFSYGLDANLPGTVETYVNGQQLCPMNLTGDPANDCRVSGESFVDFEDPVTSIAYQVVVDGFAWTENLVSFAPATNQVVNGFGPGNEFLLGRLTYANGIWTDNVRLSYNLSAVSDDAFLNANYDFELSGVLVVQGTLNSTTNTPEQNADFVYVAGDPDLGSLRAYELSDSPTGTNLVSMDIFAYLDSLHLLRFANATGGGFIDAGVALEPTPIPVSEPATWQLLLAAAGALLGLRLRGNAAIRALLARTVRRPLFARLGTRPAELDSP